MSRLQSRAVWDLIVFVINGLIFLILGLQFGRIMAQVPDGTLGHVVRVGAIISLVAIVVRLVWVPLSIYMPRTISARYRPAPTPNPRGVALVAWTGMRGIVSLASALAIPVALSGGQPFPYRAEIIVITMCVIMLTLVLQGITLTPLIRYFNFPPDDSHHDEERHARREALRRGVEALDDLSREPWAVPAEVARIRADLRDRMAHFDHHTRDADTYRRLRTGVLKAERRILVRLRNEGAISDETLRELEEELDHEAVRVGVGSER